MRLLLVVLACRAALSAQVAEPDASAKLKQFERNLANAMKQSGTLALKLKKMPLGTAEAKRVCAIPLLKVGPGSGTSGSFQSKKMPVTPPDSRTDYAIRVVTPPAPACDEQKK